jgi:hypothetical protein
MCRLCWIVLSIDLVEVEIVDLTDGPEMRGMYTYSTFGGACSSRGRRHEPRFNAGNLTSPIPHIVWRACVKDA